MFCANCAKELSDNALACPACGEPTKNQTSKDETKPLVSRKVITLAYGMGVLFPIVGFLLAIYFLIRHLVSHAIGVAVVSIFFAFFWYGVFTNLPGNAAFEWQCDATGQSALQCQITNKGPGTGSVSFEVVALCGGREHKGTVTSGQRKAGEIVQRVVQLLPSIPGHVECHGIEYRNETVR